MPAEENAALAPPDGVQPVLQGPIPGVAPATGNCVISGEVSDAVSLNPVAGAFIDVIGTGRTAETDAQGRFTIGGLPVGTFTLEATKLGYSTESAVITTLEGQPAEARFGLRVKPADDAMEETMLEEETIVGEYTGDSQGDLFLELQTTPNIASGISKEDFTKAGVSDAASAVSKIAGANIVGGKYAVVRGLGDRYSNTLFNSNFISSADPSKKAVQLDLFPSDLLQSVSIYKTFTPDLPAEFAGGTVAIKTLRFPSERLVEIEYGLGWNSNLDGEDMRTIPGREFDFFGETGDQFSSAAGSTLQGLTTGYTGTRDLNRATAAQRAAAAAAAEAFTDIHLSGGMRPDTRSPEPKQDFTILLGDTFELSDGIELGAVAGFTWSKEDQIRSGIETGRLLNPGVDGIPKSADDRLDRQAVQNEFTASLTWGALASLGLKIGDQHEIGFTYFQNHSSEDEVIIVDRQRRQDGDNLDYLPPSRTPGGAGGFLYTGAEVLTPLQRDLYVRQLDGRHVFGDPDGFSPIVEWALSNSDSIEDRPHSRSLFYYKLDYTDPRIRDEMGDIFRPELGVLTTASDLPAASQGTGPLTSFRETLSTQEEARNGRIDLTLPLMRPGGDNLWDLKIGANRLTRDREVRGRFFTYEIPSPLNSRLFDAAGNGAAGTTYLDGYDSATDPDGSPKFNGWTGTGARNRSDKLFITEATKTGRTVRNVDAFTELDACYAMTQLKLNGWDINGGVRIETENRGYEVLQGLNAPAFVTPRTEEENTNLLPGFVVSKALGADDQFNVSFAWSRTIARPTFYEFAPVQTEDQASGDVIVGNPDLTDTLIDNFDLRLDWNPDADLGLSLSLFHKSMDAPIAQAFDLFRKTWVNGTEGSLQGLELEGRYNLDDNWNLTANYTYINSLLSYEQQIGQTIQSIDSSYEGQPEHIFNLILGYDHKDSGWGGSLVYNFTGSYLTGVPLTAASPAILREAYNSLDLILYKNFTAWGCDGSVKLKFGNLLDETDTQVFEDTDFVYESFKPGRSVSLSLEMNF